MARKRRQTEVFSMSFLDCMSCGFGAVILFFMIINSHVNATTDDDQLAMMAETNRLEVEVLEDPGGGDHHASGRDVFFQEPPAPGTASMAAMGRASRKMA